ncbi:MAG: hypothetical protein K9J37_10860 [Saprospiraceae bacterium]|nr:hypothetical protein [Saprospiraceae bacterium]MCF8250405.1 hypothetical protein [Saprospiraceae bacterium]MCF8280675.1 hypothetical protein [Bacteroidales bacterium]MCF8312220.1 hypothetical protein [Saprospiraceae bacterium]MCF8440561.1 hypothetical protein [Saprospiraceae bacterium]
MKYLPVCLLLLFANGCHSQVEQPNVPATDASLEDLKWTLNDLLTMQLPSSFPDSLNGVSYHKSFSVNLPRADSNRVLVIPELRKTIENDSIFGGSKYYLLVKDIDLENLRIITTLDDRYTAILIPAKKDINFVHEPFGNEPERKVNAVTIGWYDRVQDRTLARAYVSWMQFLQKLSAAQD